LTEYVTKHPDLADEIRDFFPTLVEMEVVKAAADGSATLDDVQLPPTEHLGDFRILREIGHGGMGVVYEAEQISLGRRVALKLLTQRMLRDGVQKRRFEREAKAAARLHHTNIVPVFGSGEHQGTPYYVMQFIQGLGLDVVTEEIARLEGGLSAAVQRRDVSEVAHSLMTGEFQSPSEAGHSSGSNARAVADTSGITVSMTQPGSSASGSDRHHRKLSYWQGVARIGLQVADALEYAHRQGIVHRDVKPSNLLLDLSGTAWVTDFGLAKGDDQENLTRTGDMLGTLRYMPPEAFDGKCDVRGDVYGLGITLYELLALRPAYDQHDRHKLIKAVTSSEPPRLRSVRQSVPRDLETIVHKAIDHEPGRRYRSAAELAADLQRFLNDEPIKAREISTRERAWRWCRRNPIDAILLAGIVITFFVGFAAVSWQWRVAATARDDANRREGEAVTARDDANTTRNMGARQAAGLLLDKGIEDARNGEPARALHLFVRAIKTLPADDPQSAPLERVIRANLSAWAETATALEHIWPDGCHYADVAYSADGEMIAMAVGSDEVQCFRTDTGRPVGPQFKIPLGLGMFAPLVFAPDARSLWVGSTGRDIVAKQCGLHRFDPTSGRSIQPPIPSDGPVMSFVITPDGHYLVGAVWGLHPENGSGVADSSRTQRWRTESIVVWEAATGRVVRTVAVNAERDLATANISPDTYLSLSPDGKTVTAWVQRGTNRFEGMTFSVEGNDLPIQVALPVVESDERWNLHFQNNMRSGLAIKDDKLHRWSATEPGVLGPGVPSPIRGMLRSPSADGRSVISQNEGRVFDTGAWPPRPSGVRFAHPGWQKYNLMQSPDGRFTATWEPNFGGGNRDGRLWRLPRPHSRPAVPPTELARQPERKLDFQFAGFDPRGTIAVLWSFYRSGRGAGSERESDQSKDVRIVDATTGAVREMSVRHSALVREVVFSPDGRHFATGSFDGIARVWETATGRPAGPVLRHTNYVATVAFSPDGSTLAAGDYGPAGLVKLWDWRTGKEVRPPLRHDDIVLNVSFSPDGRYLTSTKHHDWSKNPELLFWDVASGKVVFRVNYVCPAYVVRESSRFRPDDRAFTARDTSGVLRLWEMPSGKVLGERALDGDGVTRFSPDGRVIAAAANLGVRLLDGATLAPLPGGFLPRPDQITDVAFSPDGAFLLVGYMSGSAQLWDVATRKPVGPPAVLIGAIRAVAFTADGKTCVCVAGDGTSRRWPVPEPFVEPNLDRLAERVTLMTGQRMDENQGLDSVPAGEWLTLRTKLVGDGSTALVPPRPDADWHDARAADAEQDGDAIGAEWHLDRLAKMRPNDWTIPTRRGRVLAAADRRNEADAAYAAARRLAPSPQVLADWLRSAATENEAAGRKDAAVWNLDRAVALTAEDWTLYALRSNLVDRAQAVADQDKALSLGAEPTYIVWAANRAAEAGDWKRSVAVLNGAARDSGISTQGRVLQAVANLKVGDAAGYRAACAQIEKQLAPAGPTLFAYEANTAASAFTVGPNATDEWAKPLAWIDHAMARIDAFEMKNPDKKESLRGERHAFLITRGAVLFRARRFEESVKALREGISFHPDGGGFRDWLFLALAENRLGHAQNANEAAAKARAAKASAKPDSVWDRAEVELLAAELDAAVATSGK
jgi:serine/threonine protein kinase/WD40 repeat protein/tetratricopeptide (TPR) repeat protein